MRILVTESHIGQSSEVIREAEEHDHEVLRCQPTDGEVLPCLGLVGEEGCPFDGRIDVAVDVHPTGSHITPREIGLLCAEAHEVPIIVAGTSPIGESATEVSIEGAVLSAERMVRATDARLPTYAVAGRVRSELEEMGHVNPAAWVSYYDHDGIFDVLVEMSEPISVVEEAGLDAAILPLFAEAMRVRQFGDVIYSCR